MSGTNGCLLASVALLAVAAAARPAPAQEPAAPDDPPVVVEDGQIEQPVGAGQQLDVNVDQWIFGAQGPTEARKKLESALTQDINRYDRRYELTPIQRKKLELAGRHDMQRFFDRVEDAKSEYRRANGDWNRVGNSLFELQRMQNRPHSELFGEESMLAKTLRKNLTPDQIARFEKHIYRARVEWMAGLLDRRLKLNADQHRRLVDLLVEETPPLKRYGSFDYDAIMFQMSRLAREKLRSILDEAQCRDLIVRFDQARRMQSILVSEGYLPHVGPPAAVGADRSRGSAGRVREKTALTPKGRVQLGPN
jgi:hypothetical protein